MEQFWYLLWIVLGVLLIVAEVFTFGFVLFWFGIGAFAAALTGFLGFGFLLQFLVFALVSVALTSMSRTIFSNYFFQGGEELKMGMDSLPGQVGTVTTASKGSLNAGAVKVFGSTWTAFPIDEKPLIEGEKVEVVRIQGSSIYVKRQTRELPEWRQEH